MKLFKRRRRQEKQTIDEVFTQSAEELLPPENFTDTHKVQNYVLAHCEQLVETAKELKEQKDEYRVLTSYLKDIQIIEDMPKEELAVLQETAHNIMTLQDSQSSYLKTEKKLTDAQYAQIGQEEETITKSIQTLQSNEMYQSAVKRDMQYLEGEKTEWLYYGQELANEQKILRRMAYVLFGVVLMLMTIILVLQIGFDVDATYLFVLLVAAGAVGGGAIVLRMQNNTSEIKKSEANTNRAIQLLNKTKIRYVNITNAVDYAYEKYHVRSAHELMYLWENYMEEKRRREKFEQNGDDLDYFNSKLIRLLHQFRLYDARVWVTQPQAIVDKREMVEIKHNLLERRQKLRQRIEYSMKLLKDQKDEIEQMLKRTGNDLPEVLEIVESVNRLCGIGDE